MHTYLRIFAIILLPVEILIILSINMNSTIAKNLILKLYFKIMRSLNV